MKRFLTSPYSPIGVDLDGQFIKAVQTVTRGGNTEIHAATTLRRTRPGLAPDAGEVHRFAQVLSRHGFRGRRVVIGVPSDQIVSAVLELPPAHTGAPREQIATVELAATHRRDPSSLSAAFWELPKKPRDGGVYALAVACEKEPAEAMLDLFEAEGLHVIALDAPVLALARAMGPAIASDAMTGIVRMGWSGAQIGVVRDGVVLFERALTDAGLHRVHDGLVDELGLDADVAQYLVNDVGLGEGGENATEHILEQVRERITQYLTVIDQEILLSLTYIRQEYPDDHIGRLVLAGEAATIPGLERAFARIRKMPCQTVSPTDIMSGGGDTAKSPLLCAALGLAMYEDDA